MKKSLVILGAGKSYDRESHAGLLETAMGTRVLDWLVQAYGQPQPDIQFIGGYKFNEIETKYPDFEYAVNENWRSSGATGSFFCARIPSDGTLFVSYSDILYRKDLIQQMNAVDGEVVIAIDSSWKDRYQGRLQSDLEKSEKVNIANGVITRLGIGSDIEGAQAEFIGLVRFSGEVLKLIQNLQSNDSHNLSITKLSALIEWLRVTGVNIQFVDVAADWAELNDPRDLAHFILGTKAQTLDRLSSLVTFSKILDQYTFKVHEWQLDQAKIIDAVQNTFFQRKIVIRSSALSEDGFASANAGAYDSVLNVDCSNEDAVREAIKSVILSYVDKNPQNQVLVQPMVQNVKVSGVGFTRTLSHGAPYYVLNYDDQSGTTDTITSGVSNKHKTFVLRRDKLDALHSLPNSINTLLRAMREIEGLVNYDSLDMEFAIDSEDHVYILQVRPIAVDHSEWDTTDKELFSFINDAEKRFEKLNQPLPYLKGLRAIFGIMPDWNPAEIIGINPGRLSISLYKRIIMNKVWAKQRSEYGYKNVQPTPLLESFAGHPYVDVRASFNSFVPASISPDLTEKLVTFYLDSLIQNPHFHDKVEFEIVPTCFDLNFDKWVERLRKGGFTNDEIEDLRLALQDLTQKALVRNDEFYSHLETLELRYHAVIKADLHPLRKADYLLRDCVEYGTLPFSHLARSAFVAVSLLKSAKEKAIITQLELDDFLNSIQTISHGFTEDIRKIKENELSIEAFLTKYGHIRPGTYDISSKSYREDPEYYILPILSNLQDEPVESHEAGKVWTKVSAHFTEAINNAGLSIDSQSLEQFMRKAIEGREYAKFLFSKNLSSAIDCIIEFGKTIGLSRHELAHITWEELFAAGDLGLTKTDLGPKLKAHAAEGKKWQHYGATVELPPLISQPSDFWWFFHPDSQANFIGSGNITAASIDLNQNTQSDLDLKGKIVMIPRADPGYEWLFGRQISGLITMYGGANSHMAIRAAEFNLPAAIGIGETEYKRYSGASVLTLNAGNRKIEIIQ